jgi:hypothetical protein
MMTQLLDRTSSEAHALAFEYCSAAPSAGWVSCDLNVASDSQNSDALHAYSKTLIVLTDPELTPGV